jgi:hypothetical protein
MQEAFPWSNDGWGGSKQREDVYSGRLTGIKKFSHALASI